MTMKSKPDPQALLAWYDVHRRALPWRAPPGQRAEPYRVWLSEIMLQQTTAESVRPRFERFLARWPNVAALAAASVEEVLDHWAGLGYYARARRLHRCARILMDRHGGELPRSAEALADLPGIGRYTAGAIAAIAFDAPVAAVDGNVERVLARICAIETPLPAAKAAIRARAASLVPQHRAGEFAQAMMDLGAMVCRPRAPDCAACPWQADCAACQAGRQQDFPVRPARTSKPVRRGLAFFLRAGDEILLVRRPPEGLLGGMLALPASPFEPESAFDLAGALAAAPVPGEGSQRWRVETRAVSHVFTHFRLELDLALLGTPERAALPGLWMNLREARTALPTVMRKALDFGCASTSGAFARRPGKG